MDHDDRLIRKSNTRIRLGEGGIVPVGDLVQENISEHIRSELDFAGYSGNVVSRHDRTQESRDMEDFNFGLRELFIGHGTIRGSKIPGACQNLANATAAANRLIISLHVGMQF